MRISIRLLSWSILAIATFLAPRGLAAPTVYPSYSAVSVELGQTANLPMTVYGSSGPLTYQWVLVGGSGSTNLNNGTTASGSVISGATASSLRITGTTASDAGNYALKVTDASGFAVTSQPIALSVNAPAAPVITVQPVDGTAVAGSSVGFYISATGSYPRTYQWYKGTPPDGSVVAGATTNPFTMTAITSASAGSYYVVVTNSQGSATSSAATLTVTAATPVTVTPYSSSRTVTAGEQLTLECGVSGSSPFTYQWSKAGAAVPGATNYYYNVAVATSADAGSYTLTVTNGAGSATSTPIVVTVNPPVAPIFVQQPQGAALAYGAYLSLYASATGTPSPTYKWFKDGVEIPGATYSNYSSYSVTSANAGTYTVTAINSGGSATSAAAVITVTSPVAPTITRQPSNRSAAQGESVDFSVGLSGSEPMTCVWKKDGQAISGATYSSYSISAVQPTHAGSYTVTITNAGGTITSNGATLTVTPPTPPGFYSYSTPTTQSVNLGSALSVSTPSIASGFGPFTYQWYKNGSLIPGAISSSYTIGNAQLSDSGSYVVAVTNAGGTTSAPAITVNVVPPAGTGTPWIDAKQQGNVVYFLFSSHIERYDLGSATWLASVTLTQTATAFCVASDGVYVGFGRAVSRYTLDLTSQTALSNLAGSATGLFSRGTNIYVITTSGTYPVNRQTGAVGTELSAISTRSIITPSAVVGDKLFVQTIWGYSSFQFDANGGLKSSSNTDYYTEFDTATRIYVFPDQSRICDTTGTVFNVSDDKVAGSFAGSFTDMTFLGDGTPVVLRDNVLYKYGGNGGYGETGRLSLSARCNSVFASGTTITVFSPAQSSTNSYVTATAVAASSLTATTAGATTDPNGKTYTPNAVACDENGVVYLLSQTHGNVFRWSTSTQSYLSSIPLTGTPSLMTYSPTRRRLYCVYTSGSVTEIDPSATTPVERPFGAFPKPMTSVTVAGDYLFGQNGREISLLDSNGRVTYFDDYGYSGTKYAWSPGNQTFYAVGTGSITTMGLTSGGKLGPSSNFGYYTSDLSGPVFPSPDGTRVLAASGQVYAGSLTNVVGTLANSVTGAVWIDGKPITMRAAGGGAEIQSWWPSNLKLFATAQVPGSPIAILPLSGNRTLVVTTQSSAPAFTVLNSNLQTNSTTIAATTTGAPVFTLQPAGSISCFAGSNVSLAFATSGATPQTFQWYKNGSAMAGTTTSVLQFASITPGEAGNYHVIATNSQGSTTSATITVGVYSALQITTQPSNQTVAYGNSATFTVGTSNATDASFQWYKNGAAISGSNSSTLVTDKIYYVDTGGDKYTVAITNPAGSVYSNPAIVTIGQASRPQISRQPAAVSVAVGGQSTFSIEATGSQPMSYQWLLNGIPIAGATGDSYTVMNASARHAGLYSVIVTNDWGSATSVAVPLTVGSLPTILSQPGNVSASPGAIVSFSVTVSSPTAATYQWLFNGSIIPGATSATYQVIAGQSSAGSYSVVVTNSADSVTSSVALLTIGGVAVPVFTKAPQSQTVAPGSTVTFDVAVSGVGPFTYQWYCNGLPISGGTNATLTLTNVTAASSGTYSVTVNSAQGSAAVSTPAYLTVSASSYAGVYFGTFPAGGKWALYIRGDNTGLYIASLPQNLGAVVWSVVVNGNGTFNSVATPQDTSVAHAPDQRVLAAVASSLSGTISGSSVTGSISSASLTMTGALDSGSSSFAGCYTANALNGGLGNTYTIVGGSGQALVLNVSGTTSDYAAGTVSTAGELRATTTGGSTLAATIDAGSKYLVATITGGTGGATTFGGLPSGAQNTTRLRNVSVRGTAASGDNVLIGGFSVTGGTKQMLVRGIGPTLGKYGVTGALMNPQTTAFGSGSTSLWTGAAWGGLSAVREVFSRVGAFDLDASAGDSATVLSVNSNTTIQVAPVSGAAGVALAEIYDADETPGSARLVNLSGRSNTGSGSAVLSAGFVIGGNGTATVLLRGIGPALGDFGVAGSLSAAQITLFDGNSKAIATNSGWNNDATLSAVFPKVGAFALKPNSADAVLLVNLAPGNYTVQVSGQNGATGVALVEIYEVR